MNNRYLFRGKRKDNGKWVYGNLINTAFFNNDGFPISYILDTDNIEYDCWTDIAEQIDDFEVIPETVGQCTGLKDKHGNWIFEGDIIRTKKYGRVIAHSNVNDYDIFRITYVPAVFRLENIHRAFNLVGNSADYEVIGNIHDNPELLEVER